MPTTKITHDGKSRRVNKKYVPKSLSASDKKKQVRSIIQGTKRPKLDSATTRRSPHVVSFEKKFGYKITDPRVTKELIRPEGKRQIIARGKAAYYSSGSRPSQTPSSWSLARLAAVLSTNGAARRVDREIYNKYKI